MKNKVLVKYKRWKKSPLHKNMKSSLNFTRVRWSIIIKTFLGDNLGAYVPFLFFFSRKNIPDNNAGHPNFNFLNRKTLIFNSAFLRWSQRAQNRATLGFDHWILHAYRRCNYNSGYFCILKESNFPKCRCMKDRERAARQPVGSEQTAFCRMAVKKRVLKWLLKILITIAIHHVAA